MKLLKETVSFKCPEATDKNLTCKPSGRPIGLDNTRTFTLYFSPHSIEALKLWRGNDAQQFTAKRPRVLVLTYRPASYKQWRNEYSCCTRRKPQFCGSVLKYEFEGGFG